MNNINYNKNDIIYKKILFLILIIFVRIKMIIFISQIIIFLILILLIIIKIIIFRIQIIIFMILIIVLNLSSESFYSNI